MRWAAGSPLSSVLQRHAQTMQSFDLIAQMLGHLATVTQTADRKAAIARVMPEMRAGWSGDLCLAEAASPGGC